MSLDELYATATMLNKVQYESQRFAAGLKGIDLDEIQEESNERDRSRPRTYAEIEEDAKTRLKLGKTDVTIPLTEEDISMADDLDLISLGFKMETE